MRVQRKPRVDEHGRGKFPAQLCGWYPNARVHWNRVLMGSEVRAIPLYSRRLRCSNEGRGFLDTVIRANAASAESGHHSIQSIKELSES
jgi:hypothetical protein